MKAPRFWSVEIYFVWVLENKNLVGDGGKELQSYKVTDLNFTNPYSSFTMHYSF